MVTLTEFVEKKCESTRLTKCPANDCVTCLVNFFEEWLKQNQKEFLETEEPYPMKKLLEKIRK